MLSQKTTNIPAYPLHIHGILQCVGHSHYVQGALPSKDGEKFFEEKIEKAKEREKDSKSQKKRWDNLLW
jgi:hypothetical protein